MYARHRPSGPRGRTVLKNGSVYTTLDSPTVDQVNSANIAYLGGHWYYVFGAEEAALTAAGFTLIPDTGFTLFPEETLYPEESLYPGFQTLVYP